MKFIDRYDAGERLAYRLKRMQIEKPVVLGLPRDLPQAIITPTL